MLIKNHEFQKNSFMVGIQEQSKIFNTFNTIVDAGGGIHYRR